MRGDADASPEEIEALLDDIGPAFARLRRHAPTARKEFSQQLILNVVADSIEDVTSAVWRNSSRWIPRWPVA